MDRSIDEAVSVAPQRPAAVRQSMDALRQSVTGYLADLAPLYPDPAAPDRHARTRRHRDQFLTRYATLVSTAASFGMVRSGWGELVQWRRGVFADVLAAVTAVAARMTRALADADAILAAYDALPATTPDAERFRRLQQAERLLTTQPTSPLPTRPAQYRTILTSRRATFNNRLRSLTQEARTDRATLAGLLAEVSALLPLTDVDPAGLDLTPFQDRIVAYGHDLLDRARHCSPTSSPDWPTRTRLWPATTRPCSAPTRSRPPPKRCAHCSARTPSWYPSSPRPPSWPRTGGSAGRQRQAGPAPQPAAGEPRLPA